MKKILILISVLVVFGLLVVFLPNITNLISNREPKIIACTMEAKICPDGSAVGRTGPNCEFALCPEIVKDTTPTPPVTVFKEGDLILGIGQEAKIGGLNIKINKLTQDSRCPIDVVCIQAGSVSVSATFIDKTHSETMNISSDKGPYNFGDYAVSIVSVTPATKSTKQISPNEYRITFHVVYNK